MLREEQPSARDQELLNLSLPQPCELIQRTHVPLPWNDCLQWMQSWEKTGSLLSIRPLKEDFNYRINALTREKSSSKTNTWFFFFHIVPFFNFSYWTSWQNAKIVNNVTRTNTTPPASISTFHAFWQWHLFLTRWQIINDVIYNYRCFLKEALPTTTVRGHMNFFSSTCQ